MKTKTQLSENAIQSEILLQKPLSFVRVDVENRNVNVNGICNLKEKFNYLAGLFYW